MEVKRTDSLTNILYTTKTDEFYTEYHFEAFSHEIENKKTESQNEKNITVNYSMFKYDIFL